jgi:Arc/MetJ-type ribon-helix-helix transcriptional regulator
MTTLEISLPAELKAFIKRRAEAEDRSQASLVRQALREWARQSQNEQTERAA